MNFFLYCLYRLGTLLYFLGIRVAAACGHRQARARRLGLKEKPVLFRERTAGDPLVWFHCASAGELEQAVPVMEALKKQRPEVFVLVSVFSSSGREFALRRRYACMDALAYLPDDIPGAGLRWLNRWQPAAAVFVKYEFWWGFLAALQKSQLPTFLIAVHFTTKHRRLAFLYRHVLPAFTRIFVQNDSARSFCASLGLQAQIAGDTRVDRVLSLRKQKEIELKPYRNDVPTVVMGSLWPQDLKVLAPILLKYRTNWRWILCPHKPEVMTKEFCQILSEGQPYVWPEVESLHAEAGPGIHILQQMGVLSWLYGTGHWAYVGGGFGRGIHNTLEAAVWGIPVVCGPAIQRFAEALDLQRRGVLHVIKTGAEAEQFLEKLTPEFYATVKDRAQQYFAENLGASEVIYAELEALLPPSKAGTGLAGS